jgi:hypothetical protein
MEFENHIWVFLTIQFGLLITFTWYGLRLFNNYQIKYHRPSVKDNTNHYLKKDFRIPILFKRYFFWRRKEKTESDDDEPHYCLIVTN